jgi:hypothetical protein
MQFLAAVVIIIGAVVGTIIAVLVVFALRQDWREGDVARSRRKT